MDKASRPHIICHMASSVNGKILSENWGDWRKTFGNLYEECHESFGSQAWMCGRVTMEKDFSDEDVQHLPKPEKPVARESFIGDNAAISFAIAVDAHGKLGWKSNTINGDHIIEVLTEQVEDSYLSYLQQRGISYLFAGKYELDFGDALKQLGELFPIKTIMLEGGGHINGSLLQAGLVDEISLLLLPIADATPNTPTTFELPGEPDKKVSMRLRLAGVKQLAHDVLWLKYEAGKDDTPESGDMSGK